MASLKKWRWIWHKRAKTKRNHKSTTIGCFGANFWRRIWNIKQSHLAEITPFLCPLLPTRKIMRTNMCTINSSWYKSGKISLGKERTPKRPKKLNTWTQTWILSKIWVSTKFRPVLAHTIAPLKLIVFTQKWKQEISNRVYKLLVRISGHLLQCACNQTSIWKRLRREKQNTIWWQVVL